MERSTTFNGKINELNNNFQLQTVSHYQRVITINSLLAINNPH